MTNHLMRPNWLIRKACLLALLTVGIARPLAASPEIPGAKQNRPIALVGGVIHPVSGPRIEGGVLLFEKGKITAVGKDVAIPEGAERIDLKGQHVYPGLIDAHTSLGLVEIHSVRGTVDDRETGEINPNVKAQVAVNPDSELIPVTRSGGVLLALTAPEGGLISGTSAVIQLDGWTWEDMTLKADVAMQASWPRMAPMHTWRLDETVGEQLSNRDKSLRAIKQAVADARAYATAKRARAEQGGTPPDHDARWEAMIPVLEGKMPLMIAANETQQIQSAVAFAQHEGLKLIILGGYDAPDCAELLKKYDIPVIVTGVMRLPTRRYDAYDAAYTVPARLHKAGVRYCISGAGRMGNTRNLPHQAGMAVAYGLAREEALKSVTLYAAQILGVADRVGSLAAGKDATLIVTDGDPLEINMHVTQAFVQGRRVDLSDRQKRLWEKYQEKYRRLKDEAAQPEKAAADKK
jgi:imidazolonepropionase-like amidohydrolase